MMKRTLLWTHSRSKILLIVGEKATEHESVVAAFTRKELPLAFIMKNFLVSVVTKKILCPQSLCEISVIVTNDRVNKVPRIGKRK
jgi:hypothetical protein